MKINLGLLWAILILFSACKTGERIATFNTETEKIGHLRFGEITYQILDTSKITDDMAKMFVHMMGGTLPSGEIVFDDTRTALLSRTEDSTALVREALYNSKTNGWYFFKTTDSIDYFMDMNLDKMIEEFEQSEENKAFINSAIIRKSFREAGKTIQGFECDLVQVMNPDDSTKVFIEFYITDAIPSAAHLKDGLGPLNALIDGTALEISYYMDDEIKLTAGAPYYEENPSMKKYLDFDPTKYTELTEEEFDKLSEN